MADPILPLRACAAKIGKSCGTLRNHACSNFVCLTYEHQVHFNALNRGRALRRAARATGRTPRMGPSQAAPWAPSPGGIIGNNSGGHNGLGGALIGGAIGAIAGGTIGNSVDHQNGTLYRSEYEATTNVAVPAIPPQPPPPAEVQTAQPTPSADVDLRLLRLQRPGLRLDPRPLGDPAAERRRLRAARTGTTGAARTSTSAATGASPPGGPLRRTP